MNIISTHDIYHHRAMFYGVRVVRGPDWTWGDQDDGEGNLGTVVPPRTKEINQSKYTISLHPIDIDYLSLLLLSKYKIQ